MRGRRYITVYLKKEHLPITTRYNLRQRNKEHASVLFLIRAMAQKKDGGRVTIRLNFASGGPAGGTGP